MIENVDEKDFVTLLGWLGAALLEYFVNHPVTGITTIIMLLISWERYKSKRLKTRHWRLKSQREEQDLETAKLKHEDWIKRAKIQDEEEEEIKKSKK